MWVKGHFIPKRLANAYAWLSIIFLVLTLLAILFTHIFPHFAHHHNVVVLNADYAITPHVPTSPILSLPKDSLYINSDNVYTLRQAGFSYYQISHIMQLRSRGFVFNSITDLDAIPYADSALLAMVSQGLAVTIVPALLLQGRQDGLAVRELDPPSSRTIALALPAGERTGAAAKRFADFARQWIRSNYPSAKTAVE